jgi:hypothetical protein
VSGLEDEYQSSAGLPRLIYVKSPAPERDPRLTQMLARIKDEAEVSYQHFSDAAELQQQVENDLAVLLRGWPRPRGPTAVLLGEPVRGAGALCRPGLRADRR